ncbi:MAG: phosphatase PAP2 family protein [Acidobacteriota bacterium]|nr:phosphatase PAP2 family protein [Acidobacteriota bacterium]
MSSLGDHVAQLILSIFLIVGVYQFYFWCQTNPFSFKTRRLLSPLDQRIPYRPIWVWVYSFLYYPMILIITLTTDSSRQFLYVAISYVALLAIQMALFVTFPVVTPVEWRERAAVPHGRSERFLALVQRFDAPSNSFPSMHTSVAMLTALHLLPSIGVAVFAFPLLIALSCLYTKQHYLVDLPAGALLGWMSFRFFHLIF